MHTRWPYASSDDRTLALERPLSHPDTKAEQRGHAGGKQVKTKAKIALSSRCDIERFTAGSAHHSQSCARQRETLSHSCGQHESSGVQTRPVSHAPGSRPLSTDACMIWEEAGLASGRYLAPPNHFVAVVALRLDVGVDGAGVHAEGPAVDVRALLTLHHNRLRFTRDTH